MRATTQAAMIKAVRKFMRTWENGDSSLADWENTAKKMAKAWTLFQEDVARAEGAEFAGKYYDPSLDDARLRCQLGRIWDVMSDGKKHTLQEIAEKTGSPPASVSAQLRHLRKPHHGSWIVEVKRSPPGSSGLFTYRLRNPDGTALPPIKPRPNLGGTR